MAVVVGGLPDVAPVRVVAKLGAFSYSIYLWHLWALFEVGHLGVPPPRSPLAVAAYMLGGIAVGIAMAKMVEVPVLMVRDRVFPSRSGSLALPTASQLDVAAAPAAESCG